MAAIEYGSYYWCVVLNKKDANSPAESVHLHADEMSIEANGALSFKSAGRRPAGGEPTQQNEKQEDKDSKESKDSDKGDKKNDKPSSMIYVSFAPGTWKVVYAAKLQDGTPAAIEHWSEGNQDGLVNQVPPNSGAYGYLLPRE